MKLAFMLLFIHLKQLVLFKVCFVVVVFFFFLNTTQTLGWGRNEGTEMKVSCCSPVCAYVQLEVVAKQTRSIGLNPWDPA